MKQRIVNSHGNVTDVLSFFTLGVRAFSTSSFCVGASYAAAACVNGCRCLVDRRCKRRLLTRFANERTTFLLCLTLRAFTRRSHMDSIETGLVSSSHENVEIKSSPLGVMVLWHLCLSLVPMLLESPWRANPSTQQQFYTGHNISGLARKRERERKKENSSALLWGKICLWFRVQLREREKKKDLRT